MIDKPIQISDLSLSEKDIMQEKDNSIINKSFFSTDCNFSDLIGKKNYLHIKIETLEYHLQIHSKSVKKIFELISNNDQGKLEDNYLDYITCLIGVGDELDKQQLLTSNGKEMIQNVLDPSFYELLRKTKIFYIEISKLNMNKNIHKISQIIALKNKSLEKIFAFLNTKIFDMSDYIGITIITCKDNDSLGEKFLLRAKLMGKLSNSIEDIKNEDENFTGMKNYNPEINVAEKCVRNKLHFLDFYFNNVWTAIEKENLKDENLSFYGTPFDNNFNEEFKIKNSNSNNNINIVNYDLPNSNNINNSKNINKIKNRELKDENPCGESVCGNICKIY